MQNSGSNSETQGQTKKNQPATIKGAGQQEDGSQGGQQNAQSNQSGGQLEQFVGYMKSNWRPLLSELVATGVTAYLTHTAKEKSTKN